MHMLFRQKCIYVLNVNCNNNKRTFRCGVVYYIIKKYTGRYFIGTHGGR